MKGIDVLGKFWRSHLFIVLQHQQTIFFVSLYIYEQSCFHSFLKEYNKNYSTQLPKQPFKIIKPLDTSIGRETSRFLDGSKKMDGIKQQSFFFSLNRSPYDGKSKIHTIVLCSNQNQGSLSNWKDKEESFFSNHQHFCSWNDWHQYCFLWPKSTGHENDKK